MSAPDGRGVMTREAVLTTETEPAVDSPEGALRGDRTRLTLRRIPDQMPEVLGITAPDDVVAGPDAGPSRKDHGTAVADLAADCFRAYRAGDADALDKLVRALSPLLWHIVRAYGLDAAAAEDVVQNTWVTLMRKADTVAEPQAILRWLTVTARRDAWRCAKNAGRAELTDDTADLDVLEPVPGPELDVLRGADQRSLWRNVQRLPERCQRLLRIIAFHDRPDYAALSEELGMPTGSIGPTRGRCLAKLRALLVIDPEWSES
jgi:RNA polymerase sigma factor (sigma-70 family)